MVKRDLRAVGVGSTDSVGEWGRSRALDLGRELLTDYRGELADFVEGSVQDVYHRLLAETNYSAWLNNVVALPSTTIRHVMLGALNIWGI